MQKVNQSEIKLTSFSKGSGCGCKIAPGVLEEIIKQGADKPFYKNLLVGNSTKDDAAAWDLGNGETLISTTDFFTPIVDDPFEFGRIAAANALSDVYAMGGKPVMALAILGWPVDKIPVDIAVKVMDGASAICDMAGIPIAGGHSIDSQEPIFGLSVNGLVKKKNLKKNNTCKEGDVLFLTKPLGIGILSSALKRGIIKQEDYQSLIKFTTQLNSIGEKLGELDFVHALTDITGFGLGGHLLEMTEGSNLTAVLDYKKIPMIDGITHYTASFCYPDNTTRNWNAYKSKITGLEGLSFMTVFDPQTSGGLLISVDPTHIKEITDLFEQNDLSTYCEPIGYFKEKSENSLVIENAF